MNQFLGFCVVGTVGFLIDAGILQALVVFAHANPYAARIVSFLAAASGTWLLNRHYVFAVGRRPTHTEWMRYIRLMILGAMVNYSVYAFCITFFVFAMEHPWLGVAVGSVAGLGVNFATSRLLFRQAAVPSDSRDR